MKMEEFKFNTVEEAIAAIKAGKMVLEIGRASCRERV